ncbi:MAG TPA: glutamine--fructose-6-phosphate aminotransferase, partial [Chlorobaculum parvum]|nr:glutamine--fructose-6-phosphate aminotransferase [Chlorobaculum parvum]
MCGIIGYIGKREAAPLLLNGLKRLEYRGYDSAGMAIMNGSMQVLKQKGSVGKLEELLNVSGSAMLGATIGIAHTRWATHGDPSDRNAHPHMNISDDIALIHNGIIENYTSLKKELISQDYEFESDTDSEVLVHLIDRVWKATPSIGLEGAVRQALRHVEGAYGICVVSSHEPDKIVVARK